MAMHDDAPALERGVGWGNSGVSAHDIREGILFALMSAVVSLPLVGFRITELPSGTGIVSNLAWPVAIALAVLLARVASGPVILFLRRFGHGGTEHKSVGSTLLRWGTDARTGAVLLALALALPAMPFSNRSVLDVGTIVLIYALLGLGLNVIVGLAGLLNLGYAAFYAVGAYTFALASQWFGVGFWTGIPLSIATASIMGLMIGLPVLRLRGDYLTIVTLGFGEAVRILLLNLVDITGGPSGISGIPRVTFFGVTFAPTAPVGTTTFHALFGLPFSPDYRVVFLYELTLLLALLCAFIVDRLRVTAIGRAWEALREDEYACQAIGINPSAAKLTAMILGCGIGGVAGCLFAARQGFISPESFTFGESALMLAIVVLGGLGSQVGIVIAAMALVGIPELFRELADYRLLAFGAALILVMLWRPRGFAGDRKPTVKA